MRKLAMLATLTALLGTPVHAEPWQRDPAAAQLGAYVGARIRLPMGSSAPAKPTATLTIAPMRSYVTQNGRMVNGIGEGIALDFAGRRPSLMVGGLPAHRMLGLREQQPVDASHKSGISTGGWIGIGAATVLVVGAIVVVTKFTCVGEDKDFCGSD